MSNAKRAAQRLVAEIDENEVAVIIAEACCNITRLEGQTAIQALEQIKLASPASYHDFRKAARRTLLYIKGQIEKGTIAS